MSIGTTADQFPSDPLIPSGTGKPATMGVFPVAAGSFNPKLSNPLQRVSEFEEDFRLLYGRNSIWCIHESCSPISYLSNATKITLFGRQMTESHAKNTKVCSEVKFLLILFHFSFNLQK